MSEQSGKRPRRRRGRGGRQQRDDAARHSPDGAPPGPPARSDGRAPRQDTRGRTRSEPQRESGPPGPAGRGGRTHRSPSASERPRGSDRERPTHGDRTRDGGSRSRDRGSRIFETPVPQDEQSIALGAAFKDAQVLMRDAKKALAKRKAEFGDEPDWMLEQLAAAEQRFADAATAWTAHLETTGRKVVRDRR